MSGSRQLQRRGHRVAVEQVEASQRQRLIAAMAHVAAEQGRRAASVELVCERAGMSRRTFYDHFTDGEQCFVSAVGQAFDQLFAAINTAVGAEPQDWEDRACTTVAALIATLDRDRTLARLCVVEPHSGSAVALSIRHAAVHRLALVLAAGATVGDEGLRDAAARGAVGAILELATDPILAGESLQPIVAPALYTALAPFTGRRVASLRAADPPRISAMSVVAVAEPRVSAADQLLVTELTRQTVLYLLAHPEACNVEVARAIGVRHESQMSRHLVRLERAGVVTRRRAGRANAWRLSERGADAARVLRDEKPGNEPRLPGARGEVAR
ncbi:TetR family transcriptional regulator [Baekduia sp.]|jgi:AcrR family transcriptional regulator|uniref:TetR family transcriptional regulator n=1 Tax=Baekduia sp. TaxID=2600305 RepID=UPI002E06A1B4|nr:TetR family transcriptional regulator [Baekduia sp.]